MGDQNNPFTPPPVDPVFPPMMAEEEKEKKGKLQVTTVAEAKAQLAEAKDGDNYVWGTRVWRGSKKDLEIQLASMDDGDSLVWGT